MLNSVKKFHEITHTRVSSGHGDDSSVHSVQMSSDTEPLFETGCKRVFIRICRSDTEAIALEDISYVRRDDIGYSASGGREFSDITMRIYRTITAALEEKRLSLMALSIVLMRISEHRM